MTQLKFDENGVFIPQRINYKLKKDERTEEIIEKYLYEKSKFQINYDHEGNAIFVKREKSKKREQQ